MNEAHFLSWSKWSKWTNRNLRLDHLAHPGVYALRISDYDIEDQAFVLNEGIAYFGMTSAMHGLRGRLSKFNEALGNKTGRGHGGANRFRHTHPDGAVLAESLYVAIYPFKREDSGKELPPGIKYVTNTAQNLRLSGQIANAEFVAIAEYVENFGKMPKFNDQDSPKLSR